MLITSAFCPYALQLNTPRLIVPQRDEQLAVGKENNMKVALKKMHFTENIMLFVSLSCPDKSSAISALPPCILFLNTQVIYFLLFQYNELCVKDFSISL